MCGLAGILLPEPRLQGSELSARAGAMGAVLAHRGPDDDGVWADEQAGIALAHRRLSILDLSAHGHQPMRSADDRYVIAFNGEIYNFASLRTELENAGASFHSDSDTEVLLEAIAAWGLEATLRRCNGMFALALWDRKERCL